MLLKELQVNPNGLIYKFVDHLAKNKKIKEFKPQRQKPNHELSNPERSETVEPSQLNPTSSESPVQSTPHLKHQKRKTLTEHQQLQLAPQTLSHKERLEANSYPFDKWRENVAKRLKQQ